MCLQQQSLLQERLLLQPLDVDEPPAAAASTDPSGPQISSSSVTDPSWLSRLLALFCCLPSPVSVLKAAYARWYDARARRRFLRRQRRWRQDCADMAAAGDPEQGQLVTGVTLGGGGGGGVERVHSDGDTPTPGAGGASGGGRLNTAGIQERLVENRRQLAALGAEPDPELAQYLEDERVALMLQNDEFMDELRRNREFMDALDVDTAHLERPHWRDYESVDEPADHTQGGEVPPFTKYPDDEAFRERLKHMGKASRKKFSQLARLFHFNRRSGARHMLGQGTASNGDQLLLGDDQLTEEDLSQDCPPPAPPFMDSHSVATTSARGRSRHGGDQMV